MAMGLFDRVGRVVRAQVNHWVSEAENPERLLEQAVQDMQDDLIQIRQAVAQAIATQKRTERQFHQAQTKADEWQSRAHMALQNNQDDLAREALLKRQTYITTAKALSEQLHQQQNIVAQLKRNMREMEPRLAEAKMKKDMYIARARSAEASNRLNEMLERSNPASSGAVFDRMEERVMELEARAEVSAESGRDRVEEQFASLEAGRDVDEELEVMRRQIRSQQAPQLPRFD